MGHVILCGRCKKLVELITFTIDFNTNKSQYTAENGMTFDEWAISDYNTTIFKYWFNDTLLTDTEGSNVTYLRVPGRYNVIEAGATYYASSGCFVAGTQVMIDEENSKPIEEFVSGDRILSYNVTTGEFYTAEVQKLVVNEYAVDMVEVELDTGIKLNMTSHHPVYTENGFHSLTNYNGYDTLIVGDIVKTIDGWSKIKSINRYISDPITVYTLTIHDIGESPDVDTNDTYFANGVVVHNKIG